MSPTSYRTAPPRDGHAWIRRVERLSFRTSNSMEPIDPAIASLPKIHLHCHLEGCLRAETFVDLARRYGLSTRFRPGAARACRPGPIRPGPYRIRGLSRVLLIFAAVSRALAVARRLRAPGREFVEDALAQNVMYGELFVSPSVWTFFHRGARRSRDVRRARAPNCGPRGRVRV